MNVDERTEMLERMLSLQAELTSEISKSKLDPGRLMRLQAAGVSQCIVALTVLLVDSAPSADPAVVA